MPPGGIKFKADLQAQCLCLQLERLPTELLVGSETYPFHNLYWCCGGCWWPFCYGLEGEAGPVWRCAHLSLAAFACSTK